MPGYRTETVQRRSLSAPSRGRTQLHLPLRTCWQRRHERQLLLGAYNSWGEAATPFKQTKRTHNRQVIQFSVWWAPGKSVLNCCGCGPSLPQHCILSIGVHIARYMKLLHLARNMHLARIARNMHDSVICADCARHAPVMQNYDRFLALRAMCTSSKFTIVRNMRIVSKWAYCAPCAWRYAHYMHICQNPPDRVCTRLGL